MSEPIPKPAKERRRSASSATLPVFQAIGHESDEERSVRIQLARWCISDDWRLYLETKNGEHAWEAYRHWRGIAGDEPLPRGLQFFIDQCAAALAAASTRDEVCRAIGMGAARPPTTPRGGAVRRTAAEAQRKRQNLSLWLFGEKCRRQSLAERAGKAGSDVPAFPDIYAEAAERFGLSEGRVRNIASSVGFKK